MKRNRLLFILCLALFSIIAMLQSYAEQKKAVLIVTDSKNSAMVEKEEALKKYLVHYRQKYGHNASSLPILVYDYSDSRVRSYVSRTLGIGKDDLLFLGTVYINKNLPVKVITKITQPSDADKYANIIIQEIAGRAGSSNSTSKPAAKTGSIKITSSPGGAKVFIGGVAKGKTPLTVSGVPGGKHTVTINKEGFKPVKKEVSVSAGKCATCTVSLMSSSGSILLVSTPTGGKIYVDGKYRGVTPLTISPLAPGKHKLQVVKGPAKWEQIIAVESGKKVSVKAELVKKVAIKPTPTPRPTPTVVATQTPVIISTTPTPETTPAPANDVIFIPVVVQNEVFQVTVSNVEEVTSIKDYYKPKPGFKFIVIYLSQQNISEELQVYTGQFVATDQANTSYEPLDNLSNFWSIVMKSGGMRVGYLVFEMPEDSEPMALVLHGLKMAPLSASLRKQKS